MLPNNKVKESLANEVDRLLSNNSKLENMAVNSKKLSKLNASEKIADIALKQ